MRALLIALMLALAAACSQAPVQPAAGQTQTQTQAAPAATHAAPAAATTAPAQPTPPPAPAAPPPASAPQQVPVDKDHRLVKIDTSMGDIVVQLDATRAPLTVKNFLTYVTEHYYDNSGFYRVVPGFVIQGGDFTPDLSYHRPKHPAIPNESGNGLSNQRGAIGMGTDAGNPHSAQSAFYIDLVDNRRLDPRPDRWGYAVFGQVVQGLDVVDKIAAVHTHDVPKNAKHDTFHDVPVDPVKILKVTLLPLAPAGKP